MSEALTCKYPKKSLPYAFLTCNETLNLHNVWEICSAICMNKFYFCITLSTLLIKQEFTEPDTQHLHPSSKYKVI